MPQAILGRDDFRWTGNRLRLKTGRLLATIKPDSDWPKMYRVHLTDGHVTDITARPRQTCD
jgi:hypothetical protein